MLRTQIYLPQDLRKEIENYRTQTGESLTEYIRKATQERVKKDKKKKVDLKRLAAEFVGSSTKSDAEIEEWIREIREDRRLSDERLEKRWEEAERGK